MRIGKVVEMMSEEDLSFSVISREIPSFEVLHRTVPCSWDKKGQTMRRALEEVKNKKIELVDCIKIYIMDRFFLFRIQFHIWTEAKDKTTAARLLAIYADKIKEWQT
jgi:mannose-1-phosphate guanylyltransferase/phosphomannomutase